MRGRPRFVYGKFVAFGELRASEDIKDERFFCSSCGEEWDTNEFENIVNDRANKDTKHPTTHYPKDPNMTRYAKVYGATQSTVAAYLPAGYKVVEVDDDGAVIISGTDNLGWTLDDYVIPRLRSGGIVAKEVTRPDTA
jgi:hypothetical protein